MKIYEEKEVNLCDYTPESEEANDVLNVVKEHGDCEELEEFIEGEIDEERITKEDIEGVLEDEDAMDRFAEEMGYHCFECYSDDEEEDVEEEPQGYQALLDKANKLLEQALGMLPKM